MADTNWMDEFAVTGGKTKGVTSTPKHGSPMPLDTSTKNWMDEFAVTSKVEGKSTKKEERKSTPIIGGKADEMLTKVFKPVNQFMRSLPLGLDPMEKKIMPSVMKGVPIVGQMVPKTEELSKFQEENPTLSGALSLAGGIGSTLPLAAGVVGNIVTKAIPQALGQGMLGGTLGFADTTAGNLLNEEQQNPDTSAILGFMGGAGGSLLGRAITPTVPKKFSMYKTGQRGPNEPNISKADREFRAHMGDPKVERSMQMLEETLKKGVKNAPPKPAPESAERITQALLRAGVGGLISHSLGAGPIPGVILGAASPRIPQWSRQISNKWHRNKLMNRPYPKHESYPPYFPSEDASQINRYLLNALGMQMGQ